MTQELAAALPEVAKEIEEFVAAGGWNQPAQLFALVPTASLLAAEPGVAAELDASAPLTPVAQEPLPDAPLDVALASIAWPDGVAGCALVQEIVVLPPDAEASLGAPDAADAPDSSSTGGQDQGAAGPPGTGMALAMLAARHPARREGRMVAAVLRDGPGACVLRLRGDGGAIEELVERPDLAPNLLDALWGTFAP